MRLLLNALPVRSAGNLTVARELANHLARARPAWRVVMLLSDESDMHRELRAALDDSIDVEAAPAITAHRIKRQSWQKKHLAATLRRLGIDAMLALSGDVPQKLGVPTLAHFGDPWPYLPEAWAKGRHWPRSFALAMLRRINHRRALRRAGEVGFTSAWLRDLICSRNGVSPFGHVFHNGAPADSASRTLADVAPADERRPAIVSVSEVNAYKRQSLVIRALADARLAGATYHVVGRYGTSYNRELVALAESLGVKDRVVFEGRVSDARVAELLSTSRAYALPSVCESFGLGAVEAMSYGCPVVAARAAAVPEVVGDGGVLVTPDDVAALADALDRVLRDDAHAGDLQRRGLANVGRFNWAATADAMATAIERMVNSAQTHFPT